jgi:hypothetical protein
MQPYGKIVAILNHRQLLFEVYEDSPVLDPGRELTVFAKVPTEALKSIGLSEVLVPKGDIRVTMYQTDRIVLADVFEKGGHYEQRSVASLANLFTENVKVGATRSAEIDQEDSLEVEYPRALKAGDIVGRL